MSMIASLNMPSPRLLLVAIILFFLLFIISNAKKLEVLDQGGDLVDIEDLAKAVCDVKRGTDKQISQTSTISRLSEYFENLNDNHKLSDCAKKSLPAIQDFEFLLKSGNEDVCGDEKIKLIEQFYRSYISKARKFKKQQKEKNETAPKLIRLFFMHYTSIISATCERSAVEDLKTFYEVNSNKDEETEKTMRLFYDTFGKLDPKRGYKDMFLVWNFVDSLPLGEDSKLSKYLHYGNVRIFLQLKNATSLTSIQDFCLRKLKPSYSLSLLPVIRLVDLGFYPRNEELASMLSKNSEYSDLYALIQLCETLLPIKAIPNQNLPPDQLVVLAKNETGKLMLTGQVNEEHFVMFKPANKVENIIDSILDDMNQKFIENVQKNINNRVSEQNKILRRLIFKFKDGSQLFETNKVILSEGAKKDELENIIQDSLPQINESAPLKPIEGEGEDDVQDSIQSNAISTRRKRSFLDFFKKTFAVVLLAFLTVAYFAIWFSLFIVQLFILSPLLSFWTFLRDVTKKQFHGFGNFLVAGLQYDLPNFPSTLYRSMSTDKKKLTVLRKQRPFRGLEDED